MRGASHVRSGLENQDAIGWLPPDGVGSTIIMSVADGHSDARCFRSATGARFAIEVSHALAEALVANDFSKEDLTLVKRIVDADVAKHIVRSWRHRVEEDIVEHPFREEELAQATSRETPAESSQPDADPALAYGTTLITAVVTASFMALWQIGDGDIVAVTDDGRVERAVPHLPGLLGNETMSLCSEEAWRYFNVVVTGTPPPLVLISTDGFANSFKDESGFLQFGSDVMGLLSTEGFGAVNGRLAGWLTEMSQVASGDDISLGMIVHPDLITSTGGAATTSRPGHVGEAVSSTPAAPQEDPAQGPDCSPAVSDAEARGSG